jgi:DNA polymerase
MPTDNSIVATKNKRKCKACGLYLNQLPISDNRKASSIFWVGLSSVLITGTDEQIPLSPHTKSGALISSIEEPYLNDISFYKTNIVKCLPLINDKIRYPLKHEMEKCFPNLTDEIEELKPKTIFLLGKQVAKFVLMKNSIHSFSLDEGYNYKSYNVNGINYVPVHHPSYILVYRRKYMNNYIDGITSLFLKTPVIQ